ALDDGLLARLGDVVGLDRHLPGLWPRDPERRETAFVARASRLGHRERRHVRVDPFGEVPQAVPARPARYGDLAALDHEAEQHREVLVVVPAARAPRHLA